MLDINLGGKIEIIYQAETSSSTRSLAASSGTEVAFTKIFGVSGYNTFEGSSSLAKSNYNQTVIARTIGGAI